MKTNWTIRAVGAVIFSLVLAACAPRTYNVKNAVFMDIDAQKAGTTIAENRGKANFQIIDLRTPEEYSTGHIDGATNINFYAPDFQSRLDSLDRNKTYLIYCHSGSRSGRTMDILQKMNFKSVYNLFGGMNEWNRAGGPLVK